MPLCGYLGAYLFLPILGDYVFSISFSAAIIITAFIACMCYYVTKFFYKRMNMSVDLALIFEVLFLILCFLIFRNRGTSRFMFSAENMNCVFNYTIPGIINAICVLILMQYQDFSKEYKSFNAIKKGLFVTVVYFAIFSNIFHSGMLAIYCGIMALKGIWDLIKERKKDIRNYCRQYDIYLLILVLWGFAVLFEVAGGRASTVSSGMSLSLVISVKQLIALTGALSPIFVLIAAAAFLWLLIILACKKEDKTIYLLTLLNLILVVGYLLVLCSAINYMSRIEASWGIWFYIILVILLGIADFVLTVSKAKPFLLLGLILIAVSTYYPDGRFLISTVGNIDYDTCVKTDRYIIGQIVKVESEQEGDKKIYVPFVKDEKLKWTFTDGYAESMATTLYNHGIIQNYVDVQTYADPDFKKNMSKWNKRYEMDGISKQ